MTDKYLTVEMLRTHALSLQAGDKVYLSGTIYTARDAAHLRLVNLLHDNKPMPFDLCGSVMYFAGPTPMKPDGSVGSIGPTTSSRMDPFSPELLDKGLLAMIGKGNRNDEVNEAIKRNKSVYFCAGGGFGALISQSVLSVEEIAFPELGCESIKRLIVRDMPLVVATDSSGNSIFTRN